MPESSSPQFSKLAEELIGDLRGIETIEPRRQVKRPTKSASDIIEALVNKYHLGDQASPEQAIRDRWAELVTPTLAAYSHVVEITKSDWLMVMVSNAVAKQELTNNRRLFLRKIKAVPGCTHIKGLNFRAG
ncbi:MAG: DciA family protein [Verrucomicrobiia bacterium]|tara:strand:+ start:650 stop:1042 length:393 start_codon:yes stop_codon:yes gene_type:complete